MTPARGDGSSPGPLAGLRVVDLSTVLAGPACARYLGDFGAEVVKVERPGGDGLRRMGASDPGTGDSLFWRFVGRNKASVVLDLRDADDAEVLRGLLAEADVLVENLRPGKLEALGFDPEVLIADNPRLVVTRVTGFGQDGPYADRPGFATMAEALSGFAAISGEPGGAPLLPPIALTDEVAGLVAAFATMVAIHAGGGQVVDVNLLESMLQIMGPLLATWQVHGELPPRLGSGIPYTVPRGTWRTADDRWVAVSTSAESVASRVMALLGVGDDDRFATFEGRAAHRDEIDRLMADWIGARTLDEVVVAFDAAEAAAAPVYTVEDLADDPHVAERGSTTVLDGTPMPGLVARLSRTPGSLRWAGRPLGADTDHVRSRHRHAERDT